MLQKCFPGVVGCSAFDVEILQKPLNVARMLQGSFFLKKFSNVANATEPTDVAKMLSMSWVSLHLDYYARHVKLNILGRIVIPD